MNEAIIAAARLYCEKMGMTDAYENDEQMVFAMLVDGVKVYADIISDTPVHTVDSVLECVEATVPTEV